MANKAASLLMLGGVGLMAFHNIIYLVDPG